MPDSKIVVPGHIPAHLIAGGKSNKVQLPPELLAEFPDSEWDFFTPMADMVLVKPEKLTIKDEENRLVSPNTQAGVDFEGRVLRVGPEVTRCKVGDTVVWMIGAGFDRPGLRDTNQKLVCIPQNQLIGVVDNPRRKEFLSRALKLDKLREAAASDSLERQRVEALNAPKS